LEKATFGAGCFWGVEAAYRKIKGVISTAVGYMGGTLENPSYEDVCTDKTGHVEVVKIEFDPLVISYENLLEVFWNIHDPTQLNRQGPDIGTQYKSVIFYHDEKQKKKAEVSKNKQEKLKKYSKPIVTEILEAKTFYKAEEHHQQYFEKRDASNCPVYQE
jgi:peptide-methionine (S)-S-oxide reductase